MSYSEESRPVQPVETSLKFMAWNIKEMAESQKIMSMALKNIDANVSRMMQGRGQPQQQARPQQPKPAQNFPDDLPPF
ncbi:MAG: hypothetical protein ABSA33_01815 [Candidatus Micrarchaeaceae archaeon]|jgi:hypothetical protein